MIFQMDIENDLKIIDSFSYGKVKYRRICTMSIYTFDAESQPDKAEAFLKAHPKNVFSALSVERTDDPGIFHVWLPLARDNKDWIVDGTRLASENHSLNRKLPTSLPCGIKSKSVLLWLENVLEFITYTNPIIDELKEEVKQDENNSKNKISENISSSSKSRKNK